MRKPQKKNVVHLFYRSTRLLPGVLGTGMEVLQNFHKLWVVWHRHTELTEFPGAGAKHAVHVPRVLWHGSYRTHRSSGYRHESLTELPEVPGTGMKDLQNFHNFRVYCGTGVQNFLKFRAGIKMPYPYSGSLWHRRTELPEVPGTGISVLQKLQKLFVW